MAETSPEACSLFINMSRISFRPREEISEQNKKRAERLYRMTRREQDISKVPDQHLYKFKTDRMGSNCLAFSQDGRLLAAAITKESSRTIVNVYDVEEGQLIVSLDGHKNIIHEICWSSDRDFPDHLLTVSSDMCAKVDKQFN